MSKIIQKRAGLEDADAKIGRNLLIPELGASFFVYCKPPISCIFMIKSYQVVYKLQQLKWVTHVGCETLQSLEAVCVWNELMMMMMMMMMMI